MHNVTTFYNFLSHGSLDLGRFWISKVDTCITTYYTPFIKYLPTYIRIPYPIVAQVAWMYPSVQIGHYVL